jgi:hypothetical protein
MFLTPNDKSHIILLRIKSPQRYKIDCASVNGARLLVDLPPGTSVYKSRVRGTNLEK